MTFFASNLESEVAQDTDLAGPLVIDFFVELYVECKIVFEQRAFKIHTCSSYIFVVLLPLFGFLSNAVGQAAFWIHLWLQYRRLFDDIHDFELDE